LGRKGYVREADQLKKDKMSMMDMNPQSLGANSATTPVANIHSSVLSGRLRVKALSRAGSGTSSSNDKALSSLKPGLVFALWFKYVGEMMDLHFGNTPQCTKALQEDEIKTWKAECC
jgi:hypothetical protein